MCFAACAWAKIARIVYTCRIQDAAKAGIRQIPISSNRMRELGYREVELTGELLRDESLKLFEVWSRGRPRPDL